MVILYRFVNIGLKIDKYIAKNESYYFTLKNIMVKSIYCCLFITQTDLICDVTQPEVNF